MNITELNGCYKLHRTLERSGTNISIYNAKNSMVQGVTIYGRSEVVDGEIKSVGEGYAVVDLGTLNWERQEIQQSGIYRFKGTTLSPLCIYNDETIQGVCARYQADTLNNLYYGKSDNLRLGVSNNRVYIRDDNYTDATAFKNSLNGVILYYKTADPSQGNNLLVVKTDNGTGIDGTMAAFTTALPLRGVSDTVRDKLICTADVKQVETVCGRVRLADLEWTAVSTFPNHFTADVNDAFYNGRPQIVICGAYTLSLLSWNKMPNKHLNFGQAINVANITAIAVYDTDYTTVSDFVGSLGDAELIYALATPVTTPLTTAEISQAENLQTFNPQTNVQNSSNAEMTIKYNRRSPN